MSVLTTFIVEKEYKPEPNRDFWTAGNGFG